MRRLGRSLFSLLSVSQAGLCLRVYRAVCTAVACLSVASKCTHLCARVHAGVSLSYLGVSVQAPAYPCLSPKRAQAVAVLLRLCSHTCVLVLSTASVALLVCARVHIGVPENVCMRLGGVCGCGGGG